MSTEPRPDLELEIGHVLFIDLVGYSKMLINEQSEVLQELNQVVRGSARVRSADAAGQLLRLPTGDGMALVFRENPEAPAESALEIAATLKKSHPSVRARMGIHSGPINKIADVNERANIAGGGVNFAQRVMDCGEAGHILLSQRVADDLAQYRRWQPHLHDLGETTVKHNVRVHLFNLYTAEAGNPARPSCLQDKEKPESPPSRFNLPWRPAIFLALVLLSLGGTGWWVFRRPVVPPPAVATAATEPAIPTKSIAVLPFENLSEEKANAYFADGVQDEILTNLAKIADLKVISRTSVMQYRTGLTRDLRQIGRQLGVAHLLEGSVQRAGAKVRVNAQLIDARTDAHLWAQTYDRDLADVFAIQSEIAQVIAQQLQAELAPEEKTVLAAKPTDNSEAYLLYLQANEMIHVASSRREAVEADQLYGRALALDPQFAQASARASMLNSLMYIIGRQPERMIRARELADAATRLAPNLGDTHLALALYYYRCTAEYEKALQELSQAGTVSPNNAEIFDFSGLINRRQNRWRDALAAFAKARQLDPRQAHFDFGPDSLRVLRQWPEAQRAFEEALPLEPSLQAGWVGLAYIQFARGLGPAVASATLDKVPIALRDNLDTSNAKWDYAMLGRDYAAAQNLLPNRPVDEFPTSEPRIFYEACTAYARGDLEQAHHLLEALRPLHENGTRDHPNEPKFIAIAARFHALLGERDRALAEASRAVELRPASKDAVDGPAYLETLCFVSAQVGEQDQAIDLITQLLTTPAADRITLAHLRASWEWDPLRQNPRFQKLLEGPEPATVYH